MSRLLLWGVVCVLTACASGEPPKGGTSDGDAATTSGTGDRGIYGDADTDVDGDTDADADTDTDTDSDVDPGEACPPECDVVCDDTDGLPSTPPECECVCDGDEHDGDCEGDCDDGGDCDCEGDEGDGCDGGEGD